MTTYEIKKAIDKLFSLGCRVLNLFGGEPTIRKDLIDIVEYANHKGIIPEVSTNGTLLTPDYIDKLGKAGIRIIIMSVDTIKNINKKDPEKNNIIMSDVINNLIEGRKKYGFEIFIGCLLIGEYLDSTIETIEYFNNLDIPISLGLACKNTYSDAPQPENSFFTKQEDRSKLFKILETIKCLKRKKYKILNPIEYFDDIKKFLNNELEDWYCPAGEYTFCIDCDGTFQICPGLYAENIHFNDIDSKYHDKFKKLREDKFSKCKKSCLSSAYYDAGYWIKHPLKTLKDFLF